MDYTSLIGILRRSLARSKAGLDCCVPSEVFRWHGIDLPEYWISCKDVSRINQTAEEEKKSGRWIQLEKPRVPCLIYLRFNEFKWNHVGVYIGNGWFIHTAETTGVRKERLDHPYWRNRIEGFYIPVR